MAITTAPEQFQKVTVRLSKNLLQKALSATGDGISETISEALKLIAAKPVYDKIRSLRGKLKLNINISQLREDRR